MSAENWHACAALPSLAGGQADFWRMEVSSVRLTSAAAWLSAEEQAKAARFRQDGDRLRFAAGRVVLKYLVGGYLDLPPQTLHFDLGERGKPFLAVASDLQFNLSHSGDWIVVGISKTAAVGVDVERVVPLPDRHSLLQAYFSPGERQRVESVPAERRLKTLYEAWARKEAYLKMLGRGLVDDLDRIDCSTGRPGEMWVSTSAEQRSPVTLHEACPAAGYVAALVSSHPGIAVRCWTLSGSAFR